MAVSVRFHREDPWELIRLMRAAMPNTLLNFITTGMRFIAWQPCDEDVMRLAFRCVVRNGIRRFQFAEPANDPAGAPPRRADGARGGRRGDRRRADVLDQPGAHARVLRRARRGARRLRGHRPLLPQGSRRPAHDGRRARARAALRRDGAHGRAAQPLHDRARAARLHGGPRRGLPRAPHGGRPGGERDVAADRRVDAPEPRGGGLHAHARHDGARRGVRVLPRPRVGEAPAAGRAARVRRRLLPPPAAGRDGDDDDADARRDRPPRAVPRGARGDRARARGDGVSDPRHAGLAVHGHAGVPQRRRRRALDDRLGRDGSLLPRPLRRLPGAAGSRRRGQGALAAEGRDASRRAAGQPRRRARSASARGSRTRSCCCG